MKWKKTLAFMLALSMVGASTPVSAMALDEGLTMNEAQSQDGQTAPEQQIPEGNSAPEEQVPPSGEVAPDALTPPQAEQDVPDGHQTPDVQQPVPNEPQDVPEEQTPETEQPVPDTAQPPADMIPLEDALQPEESALQIEYEFYPIPHDIAYQAGDTTLKDTVNVVFEAGIDTYTEKRAEDALGKVNAGMAKVTSADTADLLVGIANDADTQVDNWFNAQGVTDATVFQKTDAYLLLIKDGKIGVLGKDTDAAFYGLTTLKQILEQTDTNRVVRNLLVKDWADVASRGFIEGYYGEPWSTEDRVELMRWGGNFKLNSYFYAPKDDPKHNKAWRELYSPEEIESKIKPLAKAGNESKCQFVFALHPFMNSPITKQNYNDSVQILKKKFEQVIEAGVRQIAILADDAGNQGSDLYIQLMEEMIKWVSSDEMQKKYPGLKTTIPFCPVEYMYNGEGWMQKMPKNAPIVMTGGKIWGEVSNQFTNAFYDNVKRGPYMWINWPCTDNSKRHLIMGGYTTFLQPNVSPERIQGIVLNPMQQSEPSKVAIFGNACYSWHIWNEDQAEKAYQASFKYADHETYVENEASSAYRELSKHMINQNMDGRVTRLEESLELKGKLEDFKTKLASGNVTQADINMIRREFDTLAKAAETYRAQGNPLVVKQIVYWLDAWKDITKAASILMDGVEAYYINSDAGIVPSYYVEAQAQLEEAETHGFKYVDHTEYAEVGVQHIMPFLRTVRDHVAQLAQLTVDPTKVIASGITNRKDNKVQGSVNNLVDGNLNTEVVFEDGSKVSVGDYIGAMYSRAIQIKDVKFVLGRNGNPKDRFGKAKLKYTADGVTWQDVPGAPEYTDGEFYEVHGLDIAAKGIRLEAIEEKTGIWFAAREIYVNDIPEESQKPLYDPLNGKIIKSKDYKESQGTKEDALVDADDDSVVWYSTGGDTSKVGDVLGVELAEAKNVGDIHIVVGQNGHADKWKKYHVEYLENGTNKWVQVAKNKIKVNDGVSVEENGTIVGKNNGKDVIDVALGGIVTKSVRIHNDEEKKCWAKFGGFLVYEYLPTNITYPQTLQVVEGDVKAMLDQNDSTAVTFEGESKVNDAIEFKLPVNYKAGNIHMVIGNGNSSEKWKKYHLEYSETETGDNWKQIRPFIGAQDKADVIDISIAGVNVRRIRIVNDEAMTGKVKFSEVTIDVFNASKDTAKHAFSNNAEAKALTYGMMNEDHVSIAKAFSITLNAGEYLGIELPRIRQIGEVTVDTLYGDKLTLMTGANLAEMSAYTGGNVNARYIYLQNNTTAPITFYLNSMKAAITEPKAIHFDSIEGLTLASKNEDAVEQGTTGNLFDGKVNTGAKFARTQKAGGTITYDLGVNRKISKLEILMPDAERDFIRKGVIEVADSKNGTWHPVITIDKMGADGNTSNETTAGSIGWGESSSTYPNFKSYVGTLATPVDARYLRIRITEDYDHRWIYLSEIVINDGEYVPINANPTFEANPAEVSASFLPDFAADGNVATAFKPNMEGKDHGSLTYKLSTSTHIDQINILQSSSTISNAEVWVRGNLTVSVAADDRTLDTAAVGRAMQMPVGRAAADTADNGEWVQVGTLTEPLTSFYTYMFDDIYEVKLEWGNVQPIFYEIAVVANGVLEVDAAELEKLLAKCAALSDEEKSKYDTAAVAEYEAARVAAKQMIDAVAAGTVEVQAQVNEVYGRLAAAKKGLLQSVTDLETAKENLRKQLASYDESEYTSNSWKLFIESEAYINAQALLKENVNDLKKITDATIALMEAAEKILQTPSSGSSSTSTEPPLKNKPVLPVGKTVDVVANNGEVVTIKTEKIGEGYVLSVRKGGKEVTNLAGGITISLPTSKTGMGVVAVIGQNDQQKVSKDSYLKNGNMVVTIYGSCTVQMEDRAMQFSDVAGASWYKDAVDFVTARGLFTGTSKTEFSPAKPMKRGMLATVLYRLEGEPTVSSASNFQDVAADSYYANAVAWAAQEGIVTGTGDSKFTPDRSITREQLVSILYRYADSPSASQSLAGFGDQSQISSYAVSAFQWAVENGIITGKGNNKLDPKGTATRAEVSKMLIRFVTGE